MLLSGDTRQDVKGNLYIKYLESVVEERGGMKMEMKQRVSGGWRN